jgi:signal transduction histidine kinase
MNFRSKISLVLIAVGALPVAVIGVLAYQTSRDEVRALVRRSQEQTATELAREADATVRHAVEGLTLSAQALPLERFSHDELSEVLRVPYRQVADVTAIALLDEHGDAIVPPVFERDSHRDAPALTEMASHVPLEQALSLGAAIGPPYRAGEGAPRVVIAVRNASRVIAAELSLRALTDSLPPGVTLFDSRGAPLAGSATLSATERVLIATPALQSDTVIDSKGEAQLAAFAPVKALGWGVLAERPQRQALEAATRVRNYALFWGAVGLILAVALSLWLARGLSVPIASLSVAAKALQEGRYDGAAPGIGGNDELAEFGRTFHLMALELRRRDEEINGWNRELQTRVDARTAELKAAQEQILRTRRLAALGSLGAGIAHELNNPLTSVLGLAGILKLGAEPESRLASTLDQILVQARRMSTIIARLRELTELEREGAGARLPLEAVVKEALSRFTGPLEQRKITLTARFETGAPEVQGDRQQLEALVGHLVENAIHAMPDGGRLDLTLESVEGQALKLAVADSGRGIAAAALERVFDPFFTTKDDPTGAGVGLGLSTSHQIVQRHHGQLSVTSEVGKGTTFTVLLPAAGSAPHLH